ncbi:MAG TPA: hypothetical protein VFU90_00615, partial [Candidatus Tumulicola sp.]|nr:hypothetical protein [Candidatus Tumulicola sp.]
VWLMGAVALASFSIARVGRAQTPGSTEPEPPLPAPLAASFALRTPAASTGVRAETAYGLDSGASSTIVQYLSASYAPIDRLSFFVRGGWVDYAPNTGPSGTALTNVALGGQWADKLSREWRVAGAIGTGLPVGQGGGDLPDPGAAAAIAAGNIARSRLEGSTMFSPNDLAPFVGGDIAWVSHGFTVQAEANVFQLFRVRGTKVDPDATKTSFMGGVHGAYFVIPELSIGLEVRDNTFLTTPAAVSAGKTSRTWVTAGGGVRAHLQLGPHVWFRPGLAYFQPLNDPTPTISASSYHVFQLDLPLTF